MIIVSMGRAPRVLALGLVLLGVGVQGVHHSEAMAATSSPVMIHQPCSEEGCDGFAPLAAAFMAGALFAEVAHHHAKGSEVLSEPLDSAVKTVAERVFDR